MKQILFLAADLLVNKVVCLMNDADGDVGEDYGRSVIEEGMMGLEGFSGLFAQHAHVASLW